MLTSSRCGRMPKLCLWSGTVVDSERACGGACPCSASVACAAAAGWKLFADSNKKKQKKNESAVRMETAAERLHHSASRQERRSLLHIQMQMHGGSPRIHMGPSEERRLIAELPQPRDTPHPLPARKENCSRRSGSVAYHLQGSKICVYNICSASHGVNTPGDRPGERSKALGG